MKFLFAFTLLCLSSAMAELDTSECRIVKKDPGFKFEDFISSTYVFVAGTGSSKLSTWMSGFVNSIQIEDSYYTLYSTNSKDFSQENYGTLVLHNEGATIHQAILQEGTQSDKEFIVTVYGYKPNAYIQFYVCGEKTPTGDDLRFTLAYGSYKLSSDDWKKIVLNDRNNQFSGSLVKIGTNARIADTPQ